MNSSVCSSHKRGLEAEEQVIKYLKSQSYKVWATRLKTPFGEIDVLAESPQGGWGLIEVKSFRSWDWIQTRITSKQLSRLKNCRSFLESKTENKMSLCAAFVAGEQIHFVLLE